MAEPWFVAAGGPSLCATSFTLVLIFGGGPAATTLEVAIYQALRFEFDLGRAALLAAVQFTLCAAVTLTTLRLQANKEMDGRITGVTFGVNYTDREKSKVNTGLFLTDETARKHIAAGAKKVLMSAPSKVTLPLPGRSNA